MLNTTELGYNLIQSSQEEGLRMLAETFLPSFILIFITIFFLTIVMALLFLKKDFGNFLAIFIFPLLVSLILTIIFVFIYPAIPGMTGDWLEGVLSKIIK